MTVLEARRMEVPELAPRQRSVLRAVLDEYIATAQPVSSAHAARDPDLPISPASVRAVMAELTELGLLMQPHTSAGRVPTDLAFRHYADAVLLEPTGAGLVYPSLDRELAESSGEIEGLLRRAVDLLGESTGQLGFFLGARPESLLLRQVRFVRLSSERVVALLVSERGVVQSRIFEEWGTENRELERVAARLSEFVAGCTLWEARARLALALEEDRSQSDRLWCKVLELGSQTFDTVSPGSLYVGDRARLLAQPEFTDVERLRDLLGAIEEKERMVRLLDKVLRADVLAVNIGAEIDDPDIRECALIAAPLGNTPALGGLAVLGPVRMPYDRVIPLVRSLSEVVNRYLC